MKDVPSQVHEIFFFLNLPDFHSLRWAGKVLHDFFLMWSTTRNKIFENRRRTELSSRNFFFLIISTPFSPLRRVGKLPTWHFFSYAFDHKEWYIRKWMAYKIKKFHYIFLSLCCGCGKLRICLMSTVLQHPALITVLSAMFVNTSHTNS